MQSKYHQMSPGFKIRVLKIFQFGTQDNFAFGTREHNKILEDKFEFELRKSNLISEYLDVLQQKIEKTQKFADSLLLEDKIIE